MLLYTITSSNADVCIYNTRFNDIKIYVYISIYIYIYVYTFDHDYRKFNISLEEYDWDWIRQVPKTYNSKKIRMEILRNRFNSETSSIELFFHIDWLITIKVGAKILDEYFVSQYYSINYIGSWWHTRLT